MLKGWLAGSALAVSAIVMFAEPVSVLSGTVLDDRDAAASGMAVNVYCLAHPDEVFESATDDAGTFRIAVAHDGRYRVRLRDALDDGCTAVDVRGGQSTGCTLRIVRPRATITGTVRQQGAPQPGVTVVAFRPSELEKDDPTPDQTAQTDREGKFALPGLRRDETYELHAIVRGRLWPIGLLVTPPFDNEDIVLPDPAALAGHILGSTGDPLTTRFTVSCKDADSEGDADDLAVEKTFRSRDGAFRLEDLRPADWACRVTARGFAPFHFEVTLAESEVKDDLSVRLKSGAVLSGTIRTDTGEPVPRAEVSLAGGGHMMSSTTTADARGRFVFPDLEADTYDVSARHPDYAEARVNVSVRPPMTTADLTLVAGKRISGSVVTGASQTLATGARVWLTPSDDERDDPLETRADRGRFVIRHVRPGRYVLRGALATTSAAIDLVVGTEDIAGVTLQLKGRLVQGRIYGLRPGEIVTVVATATGFSTTAQTTSSGEFTLDGVPPGRLSISATRLNAVTRAATEKRVETVVPEDGNAPFLELRFDDACSISGRITRRSNPVSGATVLLVSSRTGNSVSIQTNPAGEFVFDAVEEGTHDLSVLDRRNSAPAHRTVRACSSKPVDVDLPAMRLAGQVIEKDNGEAISSATVELIIADEKTVASSQVVTDGNGRFAFDDLESTKHYTLVVRKSPGFQTKEVDVDGKTVSPDLLVKLERGVGLWVRIFDGTMRMPLRSVSVRAAAADGRETFMDGLATDERGVTSLPLTPGRYMLRLHTPGYAPLLMRDVAVPNGTVLPVAFSVGGTVQIRIGTEQIPVRAEITNDANEVPLAFEDASGELWLRQPLTTIEHLAPGRYKLKLDDQGALSHDFEVRVGELSIVDVP